MMQIKQITIEKIVWLLVVLCAMLGIYARYTGIDLWSVGDDEFITGQSVRFILNSGVPAFPCGGHYMRGIAYQYLLAAGVYIFPGPDEAVMRAINASMNLLVLPPLLLLTRRICSSVSPLLTNVAALLLACVFLVSIWEIEIARYIRFYAPIQAVFLWYMWVFYLFAIENRNNAYWGMLGLSLLSIFVHESGIFLVGLNFLPFFFKTNTFNYKRIVVAGIILISAFAYIRTDFRHLNVEQHYQQDVQVSMSKKTTTIIETPKLLLPSMRSAPLIFDVIGVVLLGWLLFCGYYIFREKQLLLLTRWALVFLLACGVLNLFGTIFIALMVLLTFGWLYPTTIRLYSFRLFVSALTALGVFWFAYGLSVDTWHNLFFNAGEFDVTKKLLVVLVKYPDIYYKILYQWYTAMPIFTISLLIVNGMGWLYIISKPKNLYFSARIFYGIILLILFAVAILPEPYASTRYTSYIYPLVLVLTAFSLCLLSELLLSAKHKEVFVLVLFGLFLTGEDANFKHLINVDTKEVNFREGYDLQRAGHLFYRIDMKTPALYINAHRGENDKILSFVLGPYFYLSRLDYIYRDMKNREFRALLACNGKKEIWTNANYLYKPEMLEKIIAKSLTPLWVIARSPNFAYETTLERKLYNKYKSSIVYTSVDKNIVVLRIVK